MLKNDSIIDNVITLPIVITEEEEDETTITITEEEEDEMDSALNNASFDFLDEVCDAYKNISNGLDLKDNPNQSLKENAYIIYCVNTPLETLINDAREDIREFVKNNADYLNEIRQRLCVSSVSHNEPQQK